MFLFDYGHLSQFEKTVMKRIMPFYTFTRKNLELQSRTLMTNPGRIEAELTGIQNISDVISGGQLTPEEEKAMPSWMKNGINILQKQHGSQFTIISGLKTPIEQPFQQFQPNALLGSISPLIRVPFEQLSGYSLYNGKLLSDVTNAATFKDAPKFLKDAIGFTEVHGKFKDGTTFTRYESLRPEIMNVILNLPPTSRVFGSLRQFETSNNDNSQKLLTFLTGIKPQTLDEQVEQAKRDKELVTKLDRLLTLSGVIGQFTKTFIPKE